MMNPFAGEVAVWLDGKRHVARLTLGALAELEAALAEGGLLELVQRFESGRFSTRDVMMLVVAGLRGMPVAELARSTSANACAALPRLDGLVQKV